MKKGLIIMMIVMVVSMIIAGLWNKIPIIGNSVHAVLDPTFGRIMTINMPWGFAFIVILITLVITLVQKYTTDQEALKQLRDDGKKAQEEMKQYKDDPKKMMEIQKRQLEAMPKSFDLTMKPLIYTAIPIILLFRWFADYKPLVDYKFLGFLSWLWAYLILSILMSLIIRKLLKVY